MSKNPPVPDESRPDGSQSGPWQVEQTVLREVSVAGDLTIGDVTQTVHLPPPPKTEPKRFTVPYLRNEFFTGRDAVLTQIHDTLGQTGTAALSQAQAIHGLGGVGKTQTAVEYAYRYFQQPSGYDWVLWVNASSLTLAGSFGAIATDLALPNHQENKLDENIAAVKRWLSTNDSWLLIFDNVDDPDVVQDFLPNGPNGRMLITSRLPRSRLEKLGVGQSIALDTLAPEDAHTFLVRRTQRDSLDADERQALETLAQELGYLPLALEQAAAYIQTKGVSFAAYWRSYQQRRLLVLEKERPQVGNYPASVATTWQINFEAVQDSSPAAADVLRLSAFLSPDNIPYEVLSLGKDHLGETLATALAEVAEDELVLPELLAELTRYSLIRLETEDRYSIHRLVQEVLRDRLTAAQRQQWLDRAVNALNAAFPSVEFENWGWCARLVEQVQAIARQPATETLDLARLLHQVGYFLKKKGGYGEVEPLLFKSLTIVLSKLGEDHPSTAASLDNLAGLYKSQGRYGEAEPLLLQALAIRRSQLGEEHRDTASSLNNLAELYQSQGRYGEAEPLYWQALEITRSKLGEEHPDTASCLNNLALLYQSQGRYKDAEPLLLQALQTWQLQFGEDHPDTARSLNNLAFLYKSQGRYGEAEPFYWKALEIRQSQLGENHPDTAANLDNLAVLYQSQGRYGEAEPLFLKALEIWRSQFGEEHPDTAISLNGLASLYLAQGRYGKAEPLYIKALEIWQLQFGKEHPQIAIGLDNLANLYLAQGRYGEAEPLYIKALEIWRSQFGEEHPDTAISLSGLANLYLAQERYGEAEPLYIKALDIIRSQIGSEHPHTAQGLNNLAQMYQVQGRYGEAEPLFLQALEIRRSQLGEEHPDTAMSLGSLAALYLAQERYGKAEPFFLQALAIFIQAVGKKHPNTQTSWQNFVYFLQQVMAAGHTADLSNHPVTQRLLAQLQQR